mmetsp:Transcript_16332/g.25119  ORF Transcript_16332/g.25119 Transcript_16332/m.25119 type:complete len:204 (+) Transcript_16332:111-722(+)
MMTTTVMPMSMMTVMMTVMMSSSSIDIAIIIVGIITHCCCCCCYCYCITATATIDMHISDGDIMHAIIHFEHDNIAEIIVLNLGMIVEQLRLAVDAQDLRQFQARRDMPIALREQRIVQGQRTNKRASNEDKRDERFVQRNHAIVWIRVWLSQAMHTNHHLANRDEEIGVLLHQLRQIDEWRLTVHFNRQPAHIAESVAKRSQ